MIHILGYASKHWKHLSAYAWSKTIVRLRHGSLHHSGQTEQGVWIETKEMGTNCWSLSALSDPCTRKGFWGGATDLSYAQGSFQVNLYKNDQISTRDIREIHEIGQNSKNKHFEVKSLTDWSFLWTLTDSVIPWHKYSPMLFFIHNGNKIKGNAHKNDECE